MRIKYNRTRVFEYRERIFYTLISHFSAPFHGAVERGVCSVAHYVVRAVCSPARIFREFNAAATVANDDAAADALMISSYAAIEPYPRAMFLPPSEIVFEDSTFPAPADVEGYLEKLYGKTWNQLPPEGRRRNHAPKVLEFG